MKNHDASEHLVCFSCRKQFRKPSRWQGIRLELRLYPREIKDNLIKGYACPDCKTPMVNMGRCFQPPSRTDKRTWDQLQLLAQQGMRFDSEFDVSIFQWEVGPRARPAEIDRFVAKWLRRPSAGQHLLQKMKQQKEEQGKRK